MTFPVHYMDVPSARNFPYDYDADPESVIQNLTHANSQKGNERNVDYALYEENIFVGYRYCEINQKKVSYPFGYGLSYTKFCYLDKELTEEDSMYKVCVTVRNDGRRSDKEVVQVYVAAQHTEGIPKPAKELKAFTKTRELHPGESETLHLDIPVHCMASFHEKENAWVVDAGKYKVLVGSSSTDIRKELSFRVGHDLLQKK